MDYSFISNAHPAYIEGLYKQYTENPESVAEGWKEFFAGFDYAMQNGTEEGNSTIDTSSFSSPKETAVLTLIQAYRMRGHLASTTNPIRERKFRFPSLDLAYFGLSEADLNSQFISGSEIGLPNATLADILKKLKAVYCSNIGFEFAHIDNQDKYQWLLQRIEKIESGNYGHSLEKKRRILEKLNGATGFENFLGKKYVAQKRFGLEGGESAIPALDAMINKAASQEVEEVVIGMAHRGRLNVLANIMGKTYEYIFSEFEGNIPEDTIFGDGDVKYHLGYSSQVTTPEGFNVHLKLVPNPSHLEAVNPVVQGFARAKADLLYRSDFDKILPILIHGDAAIAGQGVVYEVVQMSQLEGYYTGGTIHFVINNQIGFTTDFEDARSSTYCTAAAGLVQAPVFHVNGDDPEAVLFAAELAAEYRQEFNNDVFIDMVCYRKHGHNEGDDPKFTQPKFYDLIKKHKNTRTIYSEKLIANGEIEGALAKQMNKEFDALLQAKFSQAKEETPEYEYQTPELAWRKLKTHTSPEDYLTSPQTGVQKEVVTSVLTSLQNIPEDFTPLPKFKRLLKRAQELIDRELIDWSMGEHLAYGSLLLEGHDIRLSGQDVKRGTFSHRNAVLYDAKTNQQYNRFNDLAQEQGEFRIHNSLLSEFAVLGFEFGYSLASPDPLVIWEAQFGDFANGAQTMFDQFISSSESKWQRMTGLVMLLPHGYEGQGPEHSSARLERYLQSCAEFNMTVANVTTPANFFHLMRRQQARPFRKPLVVMSPKKLLRPKDLNRSNEEVLYRECVSSFEDLTQGSFQEVYDDPKITTQQQAENVKRVLCCSGKIYYELLDKKVADQRDDIAIVRLEQLYPFPIEQVKEAIKKYRHAEWFWVQEEPSNMGAWQYILAFYRNYGIQLVARKSSASPATGFKKVHQAQQENILLRAFGEIENTSSAAREQNVMINDKATDRKSKNGDALKADDLTSLKGLGKVVAGQLETVGITTFKQLAMLSSKEVNSLNKQIPGFGAKYKRYDWKTQAKVLN
ncbi:2-oxoglutarate dehydrogenase E1 component [Aureispira anguillae]|uniref:oxoglutarate dehydrogenase (succinyl-transferring) n=1 Tax=Aureispira anguillae TaxID=2864201 RepID=A0A915YIQ0_9BACT|nr:2-oxoglutarate dehydrogenase E1 component [Aureispira anguillae]BDS13940.1 2-oxoglutarate dehydrogenase E1 component [Aureispira anguillae]